MKCRAWVMLALCAALLAGSACAETTLCGVALSADATQVDLGDTKVKDYNAFMEELEQFPQLVKVDMYKSTIKRAQMAALTERFPGIRFGWTLRMGDGKWRVRTDATAFSTLNGTSDPAYKSDTFEVLKYCKDLVAIDLGHNAVKDISFLTNFPHLRVLILADNYVSDISPLAELKELEYVELFMNHIKDISPLANHEQLLDLNICRNEIEDVSPLYSCPKLERVWISHNGLTDEQKADLQAALPKTLFNFDVYSSTFGGWREHDRYFVIKDMFASRVYQPFAQTTVGDDEA